MNQMSFKNVFCKILFSEKQREKMTSLKDVNSAYELFCKNGYSKSLDEFKTEMNNFFNSSDGQKIMNNNFDELSGEMLEKVAGGADLKRVMAMCASGLMAACMSPSSMISVSAAGEKTTQSTQQSQTMTEQQAKEKFDKLREKITDKTNKLFQWAASVEGIQLGSIFDSSNTVTNLQNNIEQNWKNNTLDQNIKLINDYENAIKELGKIIDSYIDEVEKMKSNDDMKEMEKSFIFEINGKSVNKDENKKSSNGNKDIKSSQLSILNFDNYEPKESEQNKQLSDDVNDKIGKEMSIINIDKISKEKQKGNINNSIISQERKEELRQKLKPLEEARKKWKYFNGVLGRLGRRMEKASTHLLADEDMENYRKNRRTTKRPDKKDGNFKMIDIEITVDPNKLSKLLDENFEKLESELSKDKIKTNKQANNWETSVNHLIANSQKFIEEEKVKFKNELKQTFNAKYNVYKEKFEDFKKWAEINVVQKDFRLISEQAVLTREFSDKMNSDDLKVYKLDYDNFEDWEKIKKMVEGKIKGIDQGLQYMEKVKKTNGFEEYNINYDDKDEDDF